MGACNRYIFEAVWLSLQQFSCRVRLLIHLSAYFGLDCSVPCRSVRRGPQRTKFFSRTNYVIDLPSGVSNVDSTLTRAAQAPFDYWSLTLQFHYTNSDIREERNLQQDCLLQPCQSYSSNAEGAILILTLSNSSRPSHSCMYS